jgi:hypothetical protein
MICKPTGALDKMTEMSFSIGPGYATGVSSPHLNLYVE